MSCTGSTYSVEHINKGIIFKKDGEMQAYILSNGTINTGYGTITSGGSVYANDLIVSGNAILENISVDKLTVPGGITTNTLYINTLYAPDTLTIYAGQTHGRDNSVLTSIGGTAVWGLPLDPSTVDGSVVSIGTVSGNSIYIGNEGSTTSILGHVKINGQITATNGATIYGGMTTDTIYINGTSNKLILQNNSIQFYNNSVQSSIDFT